jgi:small neutral amino acid transporter SnatA (MarC family)
VRFLGRAGARVVSKLAGLILAAVAVRYVRVGVEGILASWRA